MKPGDRFVPVLHIRDDDKRRWWVIDTRPSPPAKTGTVVAEMLGESMAIRVAEIMSADARGEYYRDVPPPVNPATGRPHVDRPDPTRRTETGDRPAPYVPDEEPF